MRRLKQHIRNPPLTGTHSLDMKLVIVLFLIAYGYADKLDRTYLPPASAGTAGGSPGSLIAPGQESNFGQQAPGFRGSQSQPGPFGQQSGLSRGTGSPDFGQSRPGQASGFAQPARPSNGLKGPSSAGFGRPYGQSGGQAAQGQGPSFVQPSGTGVQPPRDSFEQSLFAESGFSGPGQSNKAFSGQSQKPQRPQAASDATADIFRYDNQIDDGSFSYEFETSNGIIVEESGVATNGVQAQGEYAYTGDDGQFYKITYTADQNGYLPQGDHLPTPPPIPQEILKSIETNAKAAAAGTQEGAYNPDEDTPQLFTGAYSPGQIQIGGSNGFGAHGSEGFQANSQRPIYKGSNQGTNQQGFNAQGSNQQGFSGPSRQGQNGSQGQGQIGYDYSRPQNQGSQKNGNANLISSSSTKTPGSQNQGRPFQGQNQPSLTGVFDRSRFNQGQYQTPEPNPPQNQSSGSRAFVPSGNNFNRGSQGVTQRNQPPGNHVSGPPFSQNRGFVPTGSQTNQGSPSFGQNRPSQNQNQPQQGSQGLIGSQASQGQRNQGGVKNQDGYEYNKPQPTFNSGNQGPFRSSSQVPTGSSSQGNFPGPQSQSGFPGPQSQTGFAGPQSQAGFPGPQSQTGFPASFGSRPGSVQGAFPGSNGTTRPQGSQGQQQGFPGSGMQSPRPTSPLFLPETTGPTSLKPKTPLDNQTTQRQETFIGPRQQASFSPEEGYKY